VAPCPIKAAEVTLKKANSRVKSRMDQRTRTQLPLLPALLRATEKHRKDAEDRINTAKATAAGVRFTAGGQEFQRLPPR
jgi:beta-lactamase class A